MAGPRIIPRGMQFWPQIDEPLGADDVVRMYDQGFAGAYEEPEETAAFEDLIRERGGTPDGEQVAMNAGFAESGKGKLSLPFLHAIEMLPGCLPGPAQARGDCCVSGTLVRMADGTEKPIEDVQVGDFVLTHNGRYRRVERTIAKPYQGDIVEIRFAGFADPVWFTPDHRFVCYQNLWTRGASNYHNWKNRSEKWDWVPAGELQIGKHLLQPRPDSQDRQFVFDLATLDGIRADGGTSGRQLKPEEGRVLGFASSNDCRRMVALDEKLAWLVGLYLAEGSCDVGPRGPKRITFNLSAKESAIAKTAVQYIQDVFDVQAVISSVPSKPSVMYVRCGNVPVASFMKWLVGGNTYSKAVPSQIFQASSDVRLACLRGWLDGDGCFDNKVRQERGKSHLRNLRLVGVSVSRSLVRGMFDLANSLGLKATLAKRKPRNLSKEAFNFHMYGSQAAAVHPGKSVLGVKTVAGHHLITADGIAAEVKSVERLPFRGEVYCLDVEEDHSFVAGSVAVHNCVAHDQKNANLITYACEVAAGLPDEVTGNIERMPEISAEGIRQGAFSTEVYYWFRRHGGDGWSCDAAARVAMREAGKVTRANHPGIGVDLTRYSGRNAGRYGRNPPTGAVADAVNNNLIRNATTLRSVDSWRDMLANGYALSTCGSEGFARTRDQHGVSRRSGSWAHAMAFIGFDDRAWARQTYNGPLVLVQNSWAIWNRGPRDIYDSAKYVPAEKRQRWIEVGLVNPDTGNIMIPQGAFWARSSDVSRRRVIAKSGVDGWPRLGVPLDLGVEGWQ